MSLKTYTVAMRNGPPVTRTSPLPAPVSQPSPWRSTRHAEATTPTIPRSGRSISTFDQVCKFGKAVALKEAKDSLLMMLDELKGDDVLHRVADSYAVLNPDFP